MFMHTPTPPPVPSAQPWRLPPHGLAVFHGERQAPRLSHYFLPRLALEGKRILFLDGANCADPRLMARLAESRGMPFAQFNQQIMLARAFTCFQLTELIGRVPQFLAEFPAQALIVTAFPELYFDEDIRHADATAAFQRALKHLAGGWGENEARKSKLENRNAAPPSPFSIFDFRVSNFSLTVALFSAASAFQPPAGRQRFFAQTCAAATELWKFQLDEQGRMRLTCQDQVLGNRELEIGSGNRGKDENRNSKVEARKASTELRVSAGHRQSSIVNHPFPASSTPRGDLWAEP